MKKSFDDYGNAVCQLRNNNHKGFKMNDRNKSTAHTTWNCKYHIVFAPKFRREILYNQKREIVGKILRKLCEWKDVEIIEAEVCPDHILFHCHCKGAAEAKNPERMPGIFLDLKKLRTTERSPRRLRSPKSSPCTSCQLRNRSG